MPAAMTQRGLNHQSLLELIASCPRSRPRNSTIVGWFQQIATTAIVPFYTDPDSSNNPELNCVFPLHNDFDFASLEWLEGLTSRPHQAPEDRFVFPDGHGPIVLVFSPTKTISTSCRRSSMRKWRNFTSLHSTVLTQEQEDYIGVKVEGPFKGGHYRHSVSCFIRGCCRGQHFRFSTAMEKNCSGSQSGRTLRGSSSSAGRPRHESSIAKNYLKSSSIEKNCLRSSSTWTSGVHRDKESLPNSPKLHRLTRFQPGHQPENWRALQEEEATHGSVSISSGTSVVVHAVTSVLACIITLMHLRVLYVVMDCSGTSVLSSRRRRGAKPLAAAAAVKRRRCGVFAMQSLERSPDSASPCFFIQKGSAGPAHLQDRRHDSVLQHQDSDPDSLE